MLRDFIGLFHDPLPAQIVAALNMIVDLGDENSDLLHEALLRSSTQGTAVANLVPLNEEA